MGHGRDEVEGDSAGKLVGELGCLDEHRKLMFALWEKWGVGHASQTISKVGRHGVLGGGYSMPHPWSFVAAAHVPKALPV